MGGSSYKRKPTKEEIRKEILQNGAEIYDALKEHPNFQFPENIPTRYEHPETVIEWVCEATARLLSPPQEDGESNELECIDVATAVRRDLKLELISQFRKHNKTHNR